MTKLKQVEQERDNLLDALDHIIAIRGNKYPKTVDAYTQAQQVAIIAKAGQWPVVT